MSSVEADLTPITEGMGITIVWQGKPIFVRHRTPAEIKEAQDVTLSQLIDPTDGLDKDRVGEDCAQDFIDQLEKFGVDCADMRRCMSESKK